MTLKDPDLCMLVKSPRVLLNYNTYMGGVDFVDRMVSHYRLEMQ